MWSEALKANGRLAKTDNIKTGYFRLVSRKGLTKYKGRPFKPFRKTSASLLEQHETYSRFGQYFLGHAPGSVAEKHYATPSAELFGKALTWLAGKYGIK